MLYIVHNVCVETTIGVVAYIKIPHSVLSAHLTQNGCRISASIMNAEAFHFDMKLGTMGLGVQTNCSVLCAAFCCR
jgi:hypothetical protein